MFLYSFEIMNCKTPSSHPQWWLYVSFHRKIKVFEKPLKLVKPDCRCRSVRACMRVLPLLFETKPQRAPSSLAPLLPLLPELYDYRCVPLCSAIHAVFLTWQTSLPGINQLLFLGSLSSYLLPQLLHSFLFFLTPLRSSLSVTCCNFSIAFRTEGIFPLFCFPFHLLCC